jgi:uncharacterized protein DUF6492
MKCDIFIRSYFKDLEWLGYCIASIHRFCAGFGLVVVLPRSSLTWLKRFNIDFGNARVEVCQDYRDDYLGQQVTKLNADKYTDAEFICHVDSDCIFTEPCKPEDLMVEGKSRMLIRPLQSLGHYRPWHQSTRDFLKFPVEYDFMVYPPFTFPRKLYEAVRNHAVNQHGVNLEEYVISRPPRGFSEYNVLGAYAYEHCKDDFSWLLVDEVNAQVQFCQWYWSWGGLTKDIRKEIKSILAR